MSVKNITKKQDEKRKMTKREICDRYEKTPKGFLMRLYRNMQSRIDGVQHEKFHLYEGKSLLDRVDYYSWTENHVDFKRLFKEYEESGYERKLAPSIDRIRSSEGYTLDNMRWVTHSVNSAETDRRVKIRVNGVLFSSIAEASEHFNIPRSMLYHFSRQGGVKRNSKYNIWEIVRV